MLRSARSGVRLSAVLLGVCSLAAPCAAQAPGGPTVTGTVTDAQALALPGTRVVLSTPGGGFVALTLTDREGRYELADVAPGEYLLRANLVGFAPHTAALRLAGDRVDVPITLEVRSFAQEVTVSALMPEVATEFVVAAPDIERRVTQDLAQSLRSHAGVTSLRRGAINLDPSVRGLYAEQIGVFVDGTRTFAAGPARMDSGLSHVSPHALQALRVVRGPYALTWGAGTLSAIRAETFRPAFSGGGLEIGGRAGYNYGANGNASDAFASLHGSSDRVRFGVQHNTRTGSDYTDGAGNRVEGDYESFDTRWATGIRVGAQTRVEYSGGFQRQNDIDYPGRILDATFFETRSHAVEFSHQAGGGMLQELAGQVYLNDKSHLMNNDSKPTAVANPHRTPPFAIRVDLPAAARTLGGRFHAALAGGPLRYKLGFDAYRLRQAATQTVSDRDTGMVHHDRHPVWPDADLTNAGAYAQVLFERGRSTIGGTLRVDREQARIGPVTSFFARNAIPSYGLLAGHGRFDCVTELCGHGGAGHATQGGNHEMHGGVGSSGGRGSESDHEMESGHGMQAGHGEGHGHGQSAAMLVPGDEFAQENTNVSAAANASLRLTDGWLVTLGVGRAVRSPSALERYADRFPAVKFQTAAEFVGNPALVPEKSLEANVGMMLYAGQASIEVDFFLRRVDDYITVAPDPNLAKRLPLSPERVFRYVQADAARFAGVDMRARSDAGAWIDLRGSWSFVRAEDVLFDEPLFGVPPFEQQYALDIHNPSRTRWFEVLVTNTAGQSRVAASRFELPTAGWTTLDLMAGAELAEGLMLRGGIQNLTDEFYVNHLNSLNPFTGQRIAEVGRTAYVGVELGF